MPLRQLYRLLRDRGRLIKHQLIQSNAKDLPHPDDLIQIRRCHIIFPFGNGLAGYLQRLRQIRLRPIPRTAMLVYIFA